MINRRSLLGLVVAAPAIVRAESLMKIWVPKRSGFITYRVDEERITMLDGVGWDGVRIDLGDGNWMMESWVMSEAGIWEHRAAVRRGSVLEKYTNGARKS